MDVQAIRVLLIEDNEDDALLVKEFLASPERGWFELRWVPDLATGIRTIERDPPNVVLLDLSLPDSHGFDTFARLRGVAPDVAVVLLTGAGDELLGLEGVRRGAQDYLPKSELTPILLARSLHYADERRWKEHERRRTEARLADFHRLESLVELASTVSHDLKNLLTTILGNSYLCKQDAPAGSDLIEGLTEIEHAAEHGAMLCRQMMAFAGQGFGELEPIDLSAAVEHSKELIRATIAKTLEVRFDLADNLPPIDADVTQIRQVLLNLVRNSAEAMADRGGAIVVRSFFERRPQPIVSLQVEDSGPGIPEELRFRVFEPNFSTKGAGRGLGLAAVRGIVRRHGASIDLAASKDGGACFSVRFAVSRRALKPTAPRSVGVSAPPDGWGGRGEVLVVDADDGVRLLARRALEQAGFVVATASDIASALRIYASGLERFRALIVDIGTLEAPGEEVLKQACAKLQAFRLLLCGANGHEAVVERLLHGNSVRRLPKPFHAPELLGGLRDLLEDAL